MRQRILAANWKMHHGPAAERAFLDAFLPTVPPSPARALWFFAPAVSLAAAAEVSRGRADVRVGAQHVHWEPKGAFTGELSIPLAREAGAAGALVGHSERRHLFGETDLDCRRKVAALLAAGLVPMLCVGETLPQREAGLTEQVVLGQLAGGLDGLAAEALGRVVIAYEPVWAIGTGRNATPQDAAAVHRAIRAELARRAPGTAVPILYGGSVNPGNAASLLAEDELDGVLVGGASLEPASWATVVSAA